MSSVAESVTVAESVQNPDQNTGTALLARGSQPVFGNQIKFKNLKPWTDLVAMSQAVITTLEIQSPSDAKINGELEQVEGGYLFHITVASPLWKFDVKEFARNPITALHRASNSVEHELSLWKKWRTIGA